MFYFKKFIVVLSFLLIQMPARAATFKWDLHGVDPQSGAYNGSLLVGPGPSGSLVAKRQIRFKSLRYHGFAVEQVWQGSAENQDGNLKIIFPVRQFGFVTKTEAFEKNLQQLSTLNLQVEIPSDASTTLKWNNETRDDLGVKKETSEVITFDPPNTFELFREPLSGTARAAIEKLSSKFYKDPYVQGFRDRPEYRDGTNYIVHDLNNFFFYQTKPSTLRILNQTVDQASLQEEELRYKAYGYSLAEKARAFDTEITQKSMDEFGLLSYGVLDQNGKKVSDEADMSTALWTGQYIYSQFLRFKSTADNAALDNIKRSVRGLLILANIQDNPAEFARSLRRIDPATYKPNPNPEWVRGAGKFADIEYHKRGNNDMLGGLVAGFVLAYEVLPDSEHDMKEAITQSITRIADNSRIAKEHVSHNLQVTGAAAIITGQAKYKKLYFDLQKSAKYLASLTPLPSAIGSITDWSGNNLGLFNDIIRIYIAKKLGGDDLKNTISSSKRDWKQVAQITPPHTFFVKGEIKPDLKSTTLGSAVARLREFPITKPTAPLSIDHSLADGFCLSHEPKLPWKFLVEKDRETSQAYQSAYAYPLFQSPTLFTSWTWRSSPFDYKGSSIPNRVNAGADYLFAYWLARFYQVVGPTD